MRSKKSERRDLTQDKLIRAVGTVLSNQGFKGLGVNRVAKAAGVDKVLVYRYFGGLPELIEAYSKTVDFWPTVDELRGPNPDSLNRLKPDQQVAQFFKSFLSALRKRPTTQDILAWELLEKNQLSKHLEAIRNRTILEYFERLDQVPDNRMLSAVVVLMAGAVNHLIIKTRITRSIGGFDFDSQSSWGEVNAAIDLLCKGIFDS
ncbi:MAG: TetR/AcrR family transcriptional regulator [Desulfobacteraceae bacterium]|mgnify:FL=1|nr:MAG: TetR/AcrR family transcriptional regulator [Desulfobacteraceae bacterium]